MFARIVTTQAKPEKIEEGIRAYREMLLPKIKKMKGFKQGYLLVDRRNGKVIGISMFESEESAKNQQIFSQSGQVNQILGSTQTPTFDVYEVAVAEVPSAVGMK